MPRLTRAFTPTYPSLSVDGQRGSVVGLPQAADHATPHAVEIG